MATLLDPEEMAHWRAWKRASDGVWDRVVRDITEATGLSAADFSVLTRVVEAATPLRQQQLADDLGWQRARLSRQLARMTDRGLIERSVQNNAKLVRATTAGVAAARRARTAHAAAVRAALLDLAPASARAFWKVVDVLGSGPHS